MSATAIVLFFFACNVGLVAFGVILGRYVLPHCPDCRPEEPK